jgi:hypothetical protein
LCGFGRSPGDGPEVLSYYVWLGRSQVKMETLHKVKSVNPSLHPTRAGVEKSRLLSTWWSLSMGVPWYSGRDWF